MADGGQALDDVEAVGGGFGDGQGGGGQGAVGGLEIGERRGDGAHLFEDVARPAHVAEDEFAAVGVHVDGFLDRLGRWRGLTCVVHSFTF
jgi:hypothetical protein